MNRTSFFIHYKYDLRKILGVALIVFLALTVKVDVVGETDEVVQFDYVSDFFHSSSETSLSKNSSERGTAHGTAASFSFLCTVYELLCKKTVFNGSFEWEEKADYFDQLTFIVLNIDKVARRGEYLEYVFTSILLNQAKGSRRWSASWTKLTMYLGGLKYDDEFWQVFSHEVGHIMDLGALQGKSKTKSSLFTEFGKKNFAIDDPSLEYYKYSWQSETIRKNGVNKKDFCSGYGMSDPFEDFAECHNLYLNHNDVFQQLAERNLSLKNKYNYLANLYGGHYFSNSSLAIESIATDWRAWDTTRIQE